MSRAGPNVWAMKRSLYEALSHEIPLQVLGVLNPFMALMAEDLGYRALYLSGAGVSNISYGLPDLGVTSLENVLEDASRITQRTDLPLLVDIDTGFGHELNIKRTIEAMEQAGVAAVHIEDQHLHKRCGHRPGKTLVSQEQMCRRIEAAVQARQNPDFIIMARTDALAVEGIEPALERAAAYVEAGADMLFPEAIEDPNDYRRFKGIGVPILANLTEFGKTPILTCEDLKEYEIDLALYPLTISRVMNKAACGAMKELRNEGTQGDLLDKMMTRDELYRLIDYEKQELKSQL